MQRTLLICRHAETADPYPLQPDFERELTKAGVHQAQNTGKWLRENFRRIDFLLASPARRAGATARIIAGRLYFEEEQITYLPDLYNAKEAQLVQCLSQLPEETKTALLVGHNPGLTRLARTLTGRTIGYLEPANVLAVALEVETWKEIQHTTGTLIRHNMEQPL